jgi:hypothetical protein
MKTLLLFLASCAMASAAAPAACNQQAPITISASGTSTIATPTGGSALRICKITFSSSTPVNVTFYGGASAITGTFQQVSTFAFDFEGQLTTGAGNAFGINLSATATLGGVVTFYQAAQ